MLRHSDLREAANALPDVENRAREQGLPLSARDMEPTPPVSDADNAAPSLLEAARLLTSREERHSDLQTLAAAIGRRDTETAREILAGYHLVVAASEAAAQKTRVDFRWDWDMGPRIDFSKFMGTKDVVKLLSLRARVRAVEGDVSGALDDLRSGHRLVRFVGEQSFLIAGLVAVAEDAILNAHESRLAAAWQGDEEALAGLEDVVDGEWQPDMAQTLHGEVYLGIATARNLELFGGLKGLTDIDENPSEVDPSKLAREGFGDTTKKKAYVARHLQFWCDVWPKVLRLRRDPWRLGSALNGVIEDYAKRKGASYALVMRTLPVFANGRAFASLLARRRTTLALIQALRERLRTGRFPEQTALLDPFDGQQLRVRTDGKESFRAYSVGPNLKDDGGVDQQELPMFTMDFDYAAAYPPIAR